MPRSHYPITKPHLSHRLQQIKQQRACFLIRQVTKESLLIIAGLPIFHFKILLFFIKILKYIFFQFFKINGKKIKNKKILKKKQNFNPTAAKPF